MLPKLFLDWFLKQIAKQLGKTAFSKFYNEFIRQPGNGDLDPYLGEYYGNMYGDADVDVSKIPHNPEYLGYYYGNLYGGIDVDVTKIPGFVPDNFNSAQKALAPVRRDPLVLDLDGDGIETLAASTTNPVLFDHDGDGLKKGTGWIKPDDGFLVMDRNNNGVIDSGRELFGDSTLLYTGGAAADGFAALAQEDTNQDGVVNSLDANWCRPLKSIHMLRCAAVLGVATYTKSTSHVCGFARLASERI